MLLLIHMICFILNVELNHAGVSQHKYTNYVYDASPTAVPTRNPA